MQEKAYYVHPTEAEVEVAEAEEGQAEVGHLLQFGSPVQCIPHLTLHSIHCQKTADFHQHTSERRRP